MIERPILCSTHEVQAILRGDMMQIRRVIKPQPTLDYHYMTWWDKSRYAWTTCHPLNVKYPNQVHKARCPYRADGEVILWVRETWYYEEHMHDLTAGEPDLPDGRYRHRYIFKADNPDYPVDVGVGEHGWKPSIHMPRKAARLFLQVKDVRVERLQDITEEDARAEGIWEFRNDNPVLAGRFPVRYWINEGSLGFTQMPISARKAFEILWNTIHTKHYYEIGWDANPWVWVVEFEKRAEDPAGRRYARNAL